MAFVTRREREVLHVTAKQSVGAWMIGMLTASFTGLGIFGLWYISPREDLLLWIIWLALTPMFGWASAALLLLTERFEIDREARLVLHVRSYLGFKTTNQEVSLCGGPEKVLIRSEPVPMNDSPLTFVALYGADGEELDVARETSLDRARTIAAEIAEFLDFEVVDLVDGA